MRRPGTARNTCPTSTIARLIVEHHGEAPDRRWSRRRPRRTSHSLTAAFATMTIATPIAIPSGAASTPGSIRPKITLTSETRTIFSRSSRSNRRPASRRRSRSMASGSTGGWPLSASNVGGRSAGGSLRVSSQRAAEREQHQDDRDDHEHPWARGERVGPGVSVEHPEDARLDGVGRVELGDVDPPLLRQLDEDPDERRDPDDEAARHPARVPADAHALVEVEEVLEGVREDEQQGPDLRQLERDDADEPVEVEEPAHVEAHRGWSSSASSPCRRSRGSRRRAPCRSCW